MFRICIITICCLWIIGVVSGGETLVEAESKPFMPHIDTKSKCPNLRIALINGVSFHFEVLAGLLHVLRPYERHIDVYMSPWIRKENYDGAWDLVRWSKANFKKTNTNIRSLKVKYDLAVVISPDYELKQNKMLLDQMNPTKTLAIVHNADFTDLPILINLTRNLELLTLSPHVATSLSKATGRKAEWMLAVYPVRPDPDCTRSTSMDQVLGLCIRGFAMQGKFSNLRRNYTGMWSQMSNHMAEINDPQVGKVFHMNVLGKGPDRLNLPQELQQHVTVHRRLPFKSFYTTICHTLALVPSLANPRYFTHKFSSTVITSLSTGTPIIASRGLLKAYSFLDEPSVFVQDEGDDEVGVMVQISKMTAAKIMSVRSSLKDLREKLNERSFELLEGYMKEVCTTDAGVLLGTTIN